MGGSRVAWAGGAAKEVPGGWSWTLSLSCCLAKIEHLCSYARHSSAILAVCSEGGTVLVRMDLALRKAKSLACCHTARKRWTWHGALSRGSVRGGGSGGGPGCLVSPLQPSEPIFCPCGSLPAILTLPMPPSAQVPHRPCPVGCPGWDTSRPLEMIPRLSHSALHTAGVQDALCFLLGGPSAWMHHREGSPELPGGRAVGVTN